MQAREQLGLSESARKAPRATSRSASAQCGHLLDARRLRGPQLAAGVACLGVQRARVPAAAVPLGRAPHGVQVEVAPKQNVAVWGYSVIKKKINLNVQLDISSYTGKISMF